MKTKIFILMIMFALLFQVGCKDDDDAIEIDVISKSQQIIEADKTFGLDVFQLLEADEETPVNFMISPLSLSMCLSMAYNGAETETMEQMAEVLSVEDFTRDELNTFYQQLIDELTDADPKVMMEIANSIWYRNTYTVEQSFLDVNSLYYNAEVNSSDFDASETVGLINQWVSDNTNEKIPEIIQNISSETVLFLINAIYFNGTWSQEFNPENTQNRYFLLADDSYVQTEMMERKDTLNYLSNDTFSAIELSYGSEQFNMMVFLPNDDKSVSDIVDLMTQENWNQWLSDFEMTNSIDIRLPKFKIEYEITLNDVLKTMGMELAFTGDADFSSINTDRDLYISLVKHKTFIEVDEEGTEAAAVTIISFDYNFADSDETEEILFHCDHPFLFAITEKETGTILFMGKVGDPTLEE
jgi:serpin B